MDYKLLLLKIVKENQPIGVHKLDRLFYDKVDFSISWAPIASELKEEGLLIVSNGYKISEDGEKYLEKNVANNQLKYEDK